MTGTYVTAAVESIGSPGNVGRVIGQDGTELIVDWFDGPSPTRIGVNSVQVVGPEYGWCDGCGNDRPTFLRGSEGLGWCEGCAER